MANVNVPQNRRKARLRRRRQEIERLIQKVEAQAAQGPVEGIPDVKRFSRTLRRSLENAR